MPAQDNELDVAAATTGISAAPTDNPSIDDIDNTPSTDDIETAPDGDSGDGTAAISSSDGSAATSSSNSPPDSSMSSATPAVTAAPTNILSQLATMTTTSFDSAESAALSSLLATQTVLPSSYISLLNATGGKTPCFASNISLPIPIQNATSWNQTGCLAGFFCPNNTAQWLPEYCTPSAECQGTRLGGGTCENQGIYEPAICKAGYYCPTAGKQQIQCPSGSFCRQGSVEPTKCSAGSRCPPGSKKDMSFLPFGILIILDVFLITVTIILKIKARFFKTPRKEKHTFNEKVAGPSRGKSLAFRLARHDQYAELGDTEEAAPFQYRNDYEMEPRNTDLRRRPTGFQQLGAMENFSHQDQIVKAAEEDRTDLHLFVESLSKCLGNSNFGLSFDFEDLKFQPKKSPKPILSQVSGRINAGSLWGVMGASGAGKSTFVNVLMGKTAHTGGVTKVNGVPGNISKYRKIIGYVPQDDVVIPEMTVRENILHSARIRLPQSWTDSEIQHHVDILISCLQLSHVTHSLVGSPGAPVISGGQRKRVSIGMELAAAPMALFLDEPTSGLDATAAASIMSTLKALTRLGMTIVTIIHQPRQEIFESLDSLVLMGAGRMIYLGPQIGIKPHFESLGFRFPDHGNPADTMGDIIAGEGRKYEPTGDASIQPLIEYCAQLQQSQQIDSNKYPAPSMAEVNALAATIKARGASFPRQVYFCFIRSILQQWRLKSSFFFELGIAAMAGFLIGLAELNQNGQNFRGIFLPPYSVLSSSIDYASVPQMALLVGLAIGLIGSAPGVKIFGEEKLMYWREAAAGHDRFAYYLGKVISTIPRMVLANLHFTTFFMLLTTPRISWMAAFAVNFLYFYCIYGLASVISMVTRREDGPLLAVMSSLIVGVLNGMSPNLAKVRTWHMVWLWRASPGTWLAEAYFTENITPLRYLYMVDDAGKRLGYLFWYFTDDCLMLLAIGTIYRIVAFLGLRYMYPSKQR